jgi:hypothetical protein
MHTAYQIPRLKGKKLRELCQEYGCEAGIGGGSMYAALPGPVSRGGDKATSTTAIALRLC